MDHFRFRGGGGISSKTSHVEGWGFGTHGNPATAFNTKRWENLVEYLDANISFHAPPTSQKKNSYVCILSQTLRKSSDIFGGKYPPSKTQIASFTGAFPIVIVVVNQSLTHPFHALVQSKPMANPKSISWLPRQLNDQLPWEMMLHQGPVWRNQNSYPSSLSYAKDILVTRHF